MEFEKITVHVPKESIITCDKGFLQKSPISDNFYVVKKLRVIGNNCFEAIGDKKEVDVKEK